MKKTPNLSSQLALQVIEAASKGCETTETGAVRGSRKLCGQTFWDKLSKHEQIQAGCILSTAVEEGRLPLVKLGRSDCNHKQYQRE